MTQELSIPRITQANVEAEQLLIGSIIANNEVLNQVGDFLKSEHFYEPIHQKIYSGVTTLLEKGLSASLLSLSSILSKDEAFIALGGKEYLARIVTRSIAVVNNLDHAKIIYDLALKRSLIQIGEDIVNETYDATIKHSAAELMEGAEVKIFNLATDGFNEKGFEKVGNSISESLTSINRAMKSKENTTGVTTGYTDLDHKLFGFQNSDLIILAARPSMGKTALALNLAINACNSLHVKNKDEANPISVGFFSLEMSAEQLSTRLIAMHSNVDSTAIRSGKITESEYNSLRKHAEKLSELPFFIDDSGALTISAIRTRARRLKRKHNLGILFIDYLQLISGNNKRENRTLEVSEITMGLKSLAKELNIPIIALSQLSRAVESREDKRPMLSDLRESGAIEQDADIVMFIYREEYYLTRKQPVAGTKDYAEWQDQLNKAHNLAEIIIAKHRNGPIGNATLFYDGNHSKFGNLEKTNPNYYRN